MENSHLSLHRKLVNACIKKDYLILHEWNMNRQKKILKFQGDKLDKFFIRIYNNNNLTKLYNHWGQRNKFVKEALDAHKNKNYLVSIPLLLIQIEGIFMDLLRVKNYLTFEGSKDKLIERLKHDKKTPFRKELINFIAKRKHKFIRSGEDRFSGELSRSRILHGHELAYDNKINSIKCINFLDYLLEIANNLIYYDKTTKVFHAWYCDRAPYFEDERKSFYFDDVEREIHSRKRSCPRCLPD